MADLTILEINLEGSSLNLPFSGSNGIDENGTETGVETDEPETDDSDGMGKAKPILAVFVFLVIAVAVVKYLTGDDEEPEVEIETPDEPVGVTIDDEE